MEHVLLALRETEAKREALNRAVFASSTPWGGATLTTRRSPRSLPRCASPSPRVDRALGPVPRTTRAGSRVDSRLARRAVRGIA